MLYFLFFLKSYFRNILYLHENQWQIKIVSLGDHGAHGWLVIEIIYKPYKDILFSLLEENEAAAVMPMNDVFLADASAQGKHTIGIDSKPASNSRTNRVGHKTSSGLTKRISVALSRILLSSFDSFDFVVVGRCLSGTRKWSVRVNDEKLRGGVWSARHPLRVVQRISFPALACGIARTSPNSFSKANNKGRTPKGTPKATLYLRSWPLWLIYRE